MKTWHFGLFAIVIVFLVGFLVHKMYPSLFGSLPLLGTPAS